MTIRILLEIADMDRDGNPEVAFYHYDEDATEMMDYDYSLFASSSEGNGRYDLISEDVVDGDGDGDVDKHDKKLYLQLADAFSQFKGFQSKR
ncbi:hypothetical protein IAI51_24020 [Pseudomonas sp. N40(2020)]|uniref:hypothetical protein n=1 Tax=Pseudomonas sp. N40(2020) TaxID=2767798 RepID=UPI0016571932|nr:hypothetical protein [Pseudomonas sp. N40(2020)]MBC8999598.1 hypothetical protein [Pseudomonas sp. N40(2020)]